MPLRARRILAVRTDRIGDAVLVTPALSLLRRHNPDAHIAVLASPYTSDIFLNNPDINEVIALKSVTETARELRARNFDAAVLFFVDRRSALSVFLSGIPLRIGPGSKIWSLLLNKIVFQRRSHNPGHEADFNTALLQPLGITPDKAPCRIKLTEEEIAQAQKYLSERFGIAAQDRLAILHPGSRGSAKNWPPENYAKMAALLKQANPSLKILLTGAGPEIPLLREIAAESGIRPAITDQALTLRQLIAVISRAGLLCTNSTGPLHLAVALGVPTVSFFPPIKGCLPQRWGPYGQGHEVLMPEYAACHKCAEKACEHFNCMRNISPESALKAAIKTAPKLFKP